MVKPKKAKPFQRFVIIGVSLIALQVALLFYFRSSSSPKSITQAIDEAVKKKSFPDPRRREQARIQLAIQNYRLQKGKLPLSLQELVPIFFEKIPIDPSTGKPFDYRVDGNRFFVGETKTNELAGGTFAGPGGGLLTEEQQKELIASLTQESEGTPFVYQSEGRRDPFIPFDFAPQSTPDPNKTELERYDLGQLRLATVLLGMGEPKAIVENSQGRGFYVQKGAKIGLNNGIVTDIESDKIVVVEESFDFTGERKTKRIELPLRTKEQIGQRPEANPRRKK